jgi:integrase
VLPRDQEPLAGLEAPPAGKPRDRHLTLEERDRLIAACAGEYKTGEVLAHMGMEMGAVLAARVRDIDFKTRMMKMRGTKNRFRDRIGVVPSWAVPHLQGAVRGKLPDARLVTCSHSKLREEHAAACKAVEITGYRFHDARHTFAVDWWSKGVPSSVIGLQLGHADGKTVEKVYGQHRATSQQLRHWADVVEAAAKPATNEEEQGL